MAYEHINGYCPICKDQIFDICDACHRPGEALANHRQFLVTFNNGNQTWLGFCEKHIKQLSIELAQEIWDGIAEATGGPVLTVVDVDVKSIESGRPEPLNYGNQMYESNKGDDQDEAF